MLNRVCRNVASQKRVAGRIRLVHTHITRSPHFSRLDEDDVRFFVSVLGEKNVVHDKEEVEKYNYDWMMKYKGQSTLVLKPTTTLEISSILKYCNERKLAVCPQGGNTGLVGGSVPAFDEIILNMSKMNKIRDFNPASGVVIVEVVYYPTSTQPSHFQISFVPIPSNSTLSIPKFNSNTNLHPNYPHESSFLISNGPLKSGTILQNLDEYLRERGHITPLDLGAKGSCQVGGNTSTNAGGIRLLRYGSLHGNILGLEVVLADGTVLDSLSKIRKDNTGYDLKQLFIGAEGTLGIVTQISLLCPPLPKSVNVALLGTNDYNQAQEVLKEAKARLGEILSAFEFWDNHCMNLMLDHHQGVVNPLQEKSKFYVLIETSGSNMTHDKEKLNSFLEFVLSAGLVHDGTLAENETQIQNIWWFREHITPTLLTKGKPFKYDISLPVAEMYNLVEIMKDRFKDMPSVFVCGYGHMGDGNLHLNIVNPEFSDVVLNIIEPFVYEFAAQHRGSVSAEHGIGLMKSGVLHYSKSSELINLMKGIKKLMDPNGILNPYKVFPLNSE
eukprot:TRINITY_DN3619_c0_g1_i1.p1 TRINITY_DN3619_c0_g1~~TRINITY_DN3619_c0_g1_i1.p1  ORF type:complete len:555 (+),score=113.36 TRINITY_DN3619_c0_g1_i1:113-1777(+)